MNEKNKFSYNFIILPNIRSLNQIFNITERSFSTSFNNNEI